MVSLLNMIIILTLMLNNYPLRQKRLYQLMAFLFCDCAKIALSRFSLLSVR